MSSTTGVHAPTSSHLGAPATILATAFCEQEFSIGWLQFLFGRHSSKWQQALLLYQATTITMAHHWTAAMISHLWVFSRKIWNTRNAILHGATAKEHAKKLLKDQHEAITSHYSAFSTNPAYLLPWHHHLFTAHSLQQHLKMSNDTGQCRLRSVEEARQVLFLHDQLLQEEASHHFHLLSSSNSSTDSSPVWPSSHSSITSTAVSSSPSFTSLSQDYTEQTSSRIFSLSFSNSSS